LQKRLKDRAVVTVTRTTDDEIPKIPLDGLGQDERQFAGDLGLALVHMDTFADNFVDDLKLFDFCEGQPNADASAALTLVKWRMVAARDGSMNIFHFYRAMKSAEKNLAKCPSLSGQVDRKKMKEANKMFSTHFPRFEEIRNSVGHAADNLLHPDKNEKHNIRGGARDGHIWVGEVTRSATGLFGRTFTTTYEGALVSYEVSPDTLIKLLAVKRAFFSAFRNLKLLTATA
jgi:hypothetical protein